MLKNWKTIRLAAPCFAIAGIVLALSVYLWPAHAQSEQDPVTQSAQEPIRIRPMPPAAENLNAPTSAPNSPEAIFTVTTLADSGAGSLRQALFDANGNGAGSDTINFTVNGTINLAGALPVIVSNLMINGPGANLLTVRRHTGGDYRIFQINGGVSVDLTGLTISNGSVPASLAGGIANFGVLTVTNCAITGNLAFAGGGIFNVGSLSVLGSTISGNIANFAGAGLHNEGSATLGNSTISGNTTNANGNGTAIYNISYEPPTATLVLVNCTVTANQGVGVGGIGTIDQGGTAETYLRNTIVANNSAPNLFKSGTNASVISQGNNLASDNGAGLLTQPSDKLNTDPQLLPLGNYGGATQTHALLASSPAVDAGTNVGAPTNDQRGFARGVDGNGFGAAAYDIGAYELRPKFVNVTTGNDANSGATLALAVKTIAQGIAIAATGDDLVIASGTYPENNLVVNKSINFQGASPTTTIVDGMQQANLGVFRVFNQTVGFNNLSVTGGKGAYGGGINNNGRIVTIANCIISGNSSGGGIGNLGGGVMQIVSSTISDNSANFGAAIYSQNSNTTLINCTISDNNGSVIVINAGEGGTALMTLTNCTVSNNSGQNNIIQAIAQESLFPVVKPGISTVQLQNTVVAANTGQNFFRIDLPGGTAAINSLGNNLDSDGTSGFTNGVGGNIVGTVGSPINAMLGALADNGGPTKTHLLQPGSPAINAGNYMGAPAKDQRGVKRPIGANADIGAVEVSSGTCATSVIYPSSLPPGAVGAIYSQQLTATGGTGPYVFIVATGSSLPAGMSLSAGGTLSGTPTTSGDPNFSLNVLDQNGCLNTQAFVMHISASGCNQDSATPITIGQTLSGQLLPGDCASLLFGDGSPSDYYTFNGTAGQQIVIGQNSTDLDAYLVLLLPGGGDVQDDNGGGGLNARIPANSGFYTLPVTGTYYILAFTYPGQSGNYTISLTGPPNNGLQFYPLATPVRLLDTRSGQSACTTPGAPITGGTFLTQLGRGTCGIPANAKAVTGNVTAVLPGANGFLTIYPSDAAAQPTASNTNYISGEVLNNVFTVGLGASDGSFRIFASTTANVVVDITGYYAPPATGGLYFHPLPKPIRLLETRTGQPGCFTPGFLLPANTETTQQGTTTCDGVTIPATAKALVGNATVVSPAANGYITLFPADAAMRPVASSGNYRAAVNLNSPFTVGLSPSGQFKIYTVATTDLVIDVLGYFSSEINDANGPGLLFNSLTPVRLLDTRTGQTACSTPGIPLNAGAESLQAARNFCTIALTAQAIVGNVTTVQPSLNGFLTFWPSNVVTRPVAATSNYQSGRNFNRYFTTGLGTNGMFKMYSSRTTNLVIDVSGYFAP